MSEHSEQLDRIEKQLERIAGFCDLVEQIAGPWLRRRLPGRAIRARVRVDTQWEGPDERD